MAIRDQLSHLLDDSGFRGPVLKLLSGTGYAFIVAYLAKIVLLRLYPEEMWGTFYFISSSVGVLAPIATLRYEATLMLPDSGRRAAHSLLLAVAILSIFLVVTLSLVIPFRHEIASFFNDESIARWLWTIPVVVLFNRLMKSSETWLTREEQFNRITGGQVIQSSAMTAFRVITGFIQASPAGLIFGLAAGHFSSFAWYLKRVWTTARQSLSGAPSLKLMREVAFRYRRFPLFTTPAGVLSAFITHMPAFLLLYYFDRATVGIYSQAFSILFIPLSQLSMVIAQVFYVRAVEAKRENRLGALASNVHGRMVMLIIFPTLALMIAGGDVFEFFFSARWRQSGDYLLFLGPWILFTAVGSPMTRLFDVLERQRLELLTTFLMFIVLASALVIGGRSGSVTLALLLLGLGGASVRILQILLLMRLARVSYTAILNPYLKYSALSLPLLLVIWYVPRFGSTLLTTAIVALTGGAYGLWILFREKLLADRR